MTNLRMSLNQKDSNLITLNLQRVLSFKDSSIQLVCQS